MPAVPLPVDFILHCWSDGDSVADIIEFLVLTDWRDRSPPRPDSIRKIICNARKAGDHRAIRVRGGTQPCASPR